MLNWFWLNFLIAEWQREVALLAWTDSWDLATSNDKSSPVTFVPMTKCKGISSGKSFRLPNSVSLRCCSNRIFSRLSCSARLSSSKNDGEHLHIKHFCVHFTFHKQWHHLGYQTFMYRSLLSVQGVICFINRATILNSLKIQNSDLKIGFLMPWLIRDVSD